MATEYANKFHLAWHEQPHASEAPVVGNDSATGDIYCEYNIAQGADTTTVTGIVYLAVKTNRTLGDVDASDIRFEAWLGPSAGSGTTKYKTEKLALRSVVSASKAWVYGSPTPFTLTIPQEHVEKNLYFTFSGSIHVSITGGSDFFDFSEYVRPAFEGTSEGYLRQRRSYTVTYNANGGSSTPAAATKWHNETLTLTSGISRTGYRLNGWLKNGGGSALSTYTDNEACVMYASWSANVYTIVYNGNGNTGGSTASSSHTYDVQKALTANGFTKTDYLFKGWATTQDGPVVYSNGQSVANLTATHGGTVNLYAVWEKAYVEPNILNLSVERVRPTTVNNDTVYVLDDEGKIGKVFITANPGKKKSVPGDQNPQPIPTRLQIYYKRSVSDASEQNLLELITYDTINTDGASSTQYIDATSTGKTGFEIGTDEQCEILVIAQGIDDSAVKCTALRSTVIMVAKYIVDFNQNPQYDSVGFFGVAPDINDVVYVKGDILIEVDPNSGTDELYNAIHALGWDNDELIN